MQPRLIQNSDVVSINKWLTRRRAPTVKASDLPTITYIIPGVAAAGIRQCEGKVGIFDSLVTNPLVSVYTRQKALDTLFRIVMVHPAFERILGFTVDEYTLLRAVKHGFRQLPYTVLSYSKEH